MRINSRAKKHCLNGAFLYTEQSKPNPVKRKGLKVSQSLLHKNNQLQVLHSDIQ